MADSMKRVFPEALTALNKCDPEVAGIIEDEKARQWCGCILVMFFAAIAVFAVNRVALTVACSPFKLSLRRLRCNDACSVP